MIVDFSNLKKWILKPYYFAFKEINKRYIIATGGRGSGKSFGLIGVQAVYKSFIINGNILVAQKLSENDLTKAKEMDYPIHCEIVRRVGYKLGKGFSTINKKDPNTGIEIRDQDNNPIIDSDFEGIRERFSSFSEKFEMI